MDYYTIGQRIRKFRKINALSQEALAEKVGISTTHMSHIETGNTKLSLAVLVNLSLALGVSTDDLLFDQSPVSKNSLMNKSEVGNAQIARNEMSHNQPVLTSTFIKPLTDLIRFESNNSSIFPDVRKNEALAKE